jgi:hypothetical protein
MLIYNKSHSYSSNRKYVQGKGFMDSLKSVGSYISQNKDLIAKPLLGAAGDLAAFGVLEGGKAAINSIMNKKKKKENSNIDPGLSAKQIEILKSIMTSESDTSINQSQIPVGNIIGSGIKRF